MFLLEGLRSVLFPRVCVSCGDGLPGATNLICPFCSNNRFEDPNPDRESSLPGVIIPEGIAFLDAMWRFDRTGGLRELLHALKYDGLVTLGHELGALLYAHVFKFRYENEYWNAQNSYILPVPMHRARERQRGYNQAYELAAGFQQASGISILPQNTVIRSRYTRSQTGFSIDKRNRNIRGAFKVVDNSWLLGRNILIIDDVFTTGSTTFELVDVSLHAGATSCGILTIAAT